MAGTRWYAARELCLVVYLELKSSVELPEIVQESQNSQPILEYLPQGTLSRRSLEPTAQHRINQQSLEARGNVSAVVLQTMKARRRLELPPGVASDAIFHGARCVRRRYGQLDRQPLSWCVSRRMTASAVTGKGVAAIKPPIQTAVPRFPSHARVDTCDVACRP